MVIRAFDPTLAPKKKPQIEAKMAEGFDEIKAMTKKMMDDAATDRAEMAKDRAKMASLVDTLEATQKLLQDL